MNLINFTPLHCSAKKNSKEIAKLLISKGTWFDGRDIIYILDL